MRLVLLAACLLPAIVSGNGLPKFQPTPLTVVFDKSTRYYQEYKIPEAEKPITRDIREPSNREVREVKLNGVRYSPENPLIISPEEFSNPTSPYEALANFLFTSRTGDAAKVIAQHDSVSKKMVEAAIFGAGHGTGFFKATNAIQKVKVQMAFEANGMTVIYGYNVFAERENLHPWVFVKEKGRYMKKAGNIEIGFLQSLGGALQFSGTGLIK